MLLSRMKVKDGRLVTKDMDIADYYEKYKGYLINGTSSDDFVVQRARKGTENNPIWENFLSRRFDTVSQAKNYIDVNFSKAQDSITEGSKIVVNTENHVNESAIAVTINESDCLVRFENGDEETVPIEAVSAFESMANDESSEETESQIAELTKNMDAARARGYDTAPYQKEIDRLKSMDALTEEDKKMLSYGMYIKVLLPPGSKEGEKFYTNGLVEIPMLAKKYPSLTVINLREQKDKYTGDPLAEKGKEVMAALKEQYGEEKGEQVFYAMKNSGQIEGIDATDGGPGSGVKGHTTAENNNTPQPSGGRTSYKENPKGRIAQKRNELIRKRTEQIKKSGGVLPHEIDYIIKPALAAIKKGIDPHKAFANAAENENYHGDREDIKADRKRIINYLSKKHGIHLNSEKIDKMV